MTPDEFYFAAAGDVHGEMHALVKYRKLVDFPDYHSGRAKFPWPVYFIGGNHEPYGFLDAIPGGGECAPNCRYLGRAICTEIEGLRIAGLSGIYHPERSFAPRPPIADISRVSNKEYIYFTETEVQALMEAERADILLVHEWPAGVIASEDEHRFERQRRSMRYDDVGNEYAQMLMETLKPGLTLAGHMHISYANSIIFDHEKLPFRALAHVAFGLDAVALFRVRDGKIEEIKGP